MIKILRQNRRAATILLFVFCSVIIFPFLCNLTAVAAGCPYGSWDIDLVKRIEVSNFFNRMIRDIGWGILYGLAKIIDGFESAINTIVHLNLYDAIKEFFNFDGWVYSLVSIVFSVTLILVATWLMVFHSKGRMSSFLRSAIIASFLIFAFPTLMSAMTDIKEAGINDIEKINVDSNSDSQITHSMGDTLLSSLVVDMNTSAEKSGKLTYLNQSKNYKQMSGYSYKLDINSVIDADKSNYYKWKVSELEPVESRQVTYTDLTQDNMLDLLRIGSLYTQIIEQQEIYDHTNNDNKTSTDKSVQYGYVLVSYVTDNSDGGMKQTINEYVSPYTAFNNYLVPQIYMTICNDDVAKKYAADVKKQLLVNAPNTPFGLTANSDCKLVDRTVESSARKAPAIIKSILSQLNKDGIIKQLNITKNQYLAVQEDKNFNVYYSKLYSQAAFENDLDESWVEPTAYISAFFSNTFGEMYENVFAYDYDFIYGLILLVTVLICMLFAGVKLVRMILDIMFMQIIAPLIFASDLQGSGRTKKVLQELFSCVLVIIIVLLLIKVYTMVLLWTFRSDMSIFVKLLMVIGGMGFVIDGPDIVTKILGVDAGVKTGYGAMIATMGVARGVSRAGHSVKNFGSSAARHVVGSKQQGGGRNGGIVPTATNAAKSLSNKKRDFSSGAKGAKSVGQSGIKGGIRGVKANSPKEAARQSAVAQKIERGENAFNAGAGINGSNGISETGTNGVNGISGTNGTNGSAGISDTGIDGNVGANGTKGTDGSVVSKAINNGNTNKTLSSSVSSQSSKNTIKQPQSVNNSNTNKKSTQQSHKKPQNTNANKQQSNNKNINNSNNQSLKPQQQRQQTNDYNNKQPQQPPPQQTDTSRTYQNNQYNNNNDNEKGRDD